MYNWYELILIYGLALVALWNMRRMAKKWIKNEKRLVDAQFWVGMLFFVVLANLIYSGYYGWNKLENVTSVIEQVLDSASAVSIIVAGGMYYFHILTDKIEQKEKKLEKNK